MDRGGEQNRPKDQASSKVQQRSSAHAPASGRTFVLLALDAHRDPLTTRSSRYWRPRRRYEDLCLAVAVRRVQRDWLLSTTDAECAKPGVRARLLAWTRLDLAHQTEELARSPRWLSSGARRKAEARARKRFETIAAQARGEVPAELLRAAQVSSPECDAAKLESIKDQGYSPPLRPALSPHALRVAASPPQPGLGDRASRLHDALGSSAVLRPKGKPLDRPRIERAGAHWHTALALAISVGLVVLLGLAGLLFQTPTGDENGPFTNGSGGAKGGNGGARAPADTPAWIPAAPTVALTAHVKQDERLGPVHTEPLLFPLTAWVQPTVAHDRDCSDFKSQRQANRWFRKHYPRRDPSGLDSDHDGRACEGRPCPCSRHRVRGDRGGPSRNPGLSEHLPVSAPTSRGSAPSPAATPSPSVTQSVRSVDRAVSNTEVQTGLSQPTGGLIGRLDEVVHDAGRTVNRAAGGVNRATGGLLG